MKHITDPLLQLLEPYRYVSVVCGQWGDTGKGKVVDLLADGWADAVIRRTGSANAGHTVVPKDKETILHLIPSCILHDARGLQNIIDEGVAFDPAEAWDSEIVPLRADGIACTNLHISHMAKLLLPQHIVMDMVRETSPGEFKVGTTGRGVGPCYTDFYARTGLVANDLLNRDVFVRKLRQNLKDKARLLSFADPEIVKKAMQDPRLGSGIYLKDGYHGQADGTGPFDADAIIEHYLRYGERLREFIRDTRELIRRLINKMKHIVFEGAQGTLLSVDYGTYPNVTSSDASFHGLTHGLPIKREDIFSLMIMKAFYMTRVGNGPFPTEFGGALSEAWCRHAEREAEEGQYAHLTVNDPDPFLQGIAIRMAGHEYGATTKRSRRTGWFDLPAAKYARLVNDTPNVVTTKSDVLDDCDTIKICVAYRYTGSNYHLGDQLLTKGTQFTVAPMDDFVLQYCEPEYREFPGWRSKTSDITDMRDMPAAFRTILDFCENEADFHTQICSVGPKRSQTIIRG